MKKIVVLIVVLFIAVILTGCGGSSDPAAAPASQTADPAASPAAGTPENGQAAAPQPDPELAVPRAFEVNKSTPEFFREAIQKKDPIFILFYATDEISQDVLQEARKVYENKNYSGAVNFMLLRIDENKDITRLVMEFHVKYIPYTAIINRDGQIIFEKTGYVDSKTLEQAVYNAVNK